METSYAEIKDAYTSLPPADGRYFAHLRNTQEVQILRSIVEAREGNQQIKTLRIPFQNMGDIIVATAIFHTFNTEVLKGSYRISLENPPKSDNLYRLFHQMTNYAEKTHAVLPIQEILLQELGCIYDKNVQGITVNHPPMLFDQQYGKDMLRVADIPEQGEHILQQLDHSSPVVLIMQVGSKPNKRTSAEQIITLGRHVKETNPHAQIIVATDGRDLPSQPAVTYDQIRTIATAFYQHPTPNILAGLGYAIAKTNGYVISTDSGPTWLVSGGIYQTDSRYPFKNMHVLYTVADPTVWSIPGCTSYMSETLIQAQKDGYEFYYGVCSEFISGIPPIEDSDLDQITSSLTHIS